MIIYNCAIYISIKETTYRKEKNNNALSPHIFTSGRSELIPMFSVHSASIADVFSAWLMLLLFYPTMHINNNFLLQDK